MNRARPRVTAVLAVLVGLGLLAQTLLFLWLARTVHITALLAALSFGLLGLGVTWRMVRRAMRPLVIESWRLQEIAIGWEAERALSSPSLVGSDRTLDEIEQLRRELFDRLKESHRLRKRAEEASDYKTGFLKSLQHELRTPLNSILGFAEVLLSGIEGPLSTGQRENLVVISRTGRRLQDLFDEVIELAAMAAGQVELRHDAIDVGAALEEVAEALEEERGDRPVHIRVDLSDALPHVAGDEERLKRLLKGIASQSLSVLNGQLLVLGAAQGSEHCVRLSVRDPLRKLAPEDIESLLGPGPTPVRRKGLDEGSRLRIAIWRQLAALFGGRLDLRSDDAGTEFVIELPAWRQP
jgi:signal transduction histidine kinase